MFNQAQLTAAAKRQGITVEELRARCLRVTATLQPEKPTTLARAQNAAALLFLIALGLWTAVGVVFLASDLAEGVASIFAGVGDQPSPEPSLEIVEWLTL